MDWAYATVPALEDSLVKLHMEKEWRHHVENPGNPSNEYANYSGELGMYQINSTFLESIREEIKMKSLMNYGGWTLMEPILEQERVLG